MGNFRGDKITGRLSLILGNDEDSSIRRWAAEIIGRSKAEKGFKPLLKALDDKNFQVRKVAIQYLGNYNNEELIDRLIVALQEDKAGSIRRRAAELLGKSMNKKVITALVAALQDKYIMVRMEAAWALGEIGNFKAVAPLLNNLSRGNPIGRKKSFKALGKIKDERAIPILIIFLRSSRIKWLKTTINNALKKISGQKFKADWKAWNSWWEKKKKTALSKKKLARG